MTLQTKIGSAAAETAETLERLGVDTSLWTGGGRAVRSPVTGEVIGPVHDTSPPAVAAAIEAAHTPYPAWPHVPPPRPGGPVGPLREEPAPAKADLPPLGTPEA